MILYTFFLSLALAIIPLQASQEKGQHIALTAKQSQAYEQYRAILCEQASAILEQQESDPNQKLNLVAVPKAVGILLNEPNRKTIFSKDFPHEKIEGFSAKLLAEQLSENAEKVAPAVVTMVKCAVTDITSTLEGLAKFIVEEIGEKKLATELAKHNTIAPQQQSFFWKKYLFLGGTALLLAALFYYKFNGKMEFL